MGLYCSVASYVALGVPAAKVTPILPWIGPAFLACKDGDCSLRDNPDAWEGYPGCFLPGYCGMPWPSDRGVPSPCKGWQLCSPGGMQWSALMKMVANSTTGGLQWSERWQQPYFTVPPGVYPDPQTNASGSHASIW